MKKKKFLLLGIASIAFVLAACDNSAPATSSTTVDNTPSTTADDTPSTTTDDTSTTTTEEEEKEEVYLYNSKDASTIISKQEVVLNKPLLKQLNIPVKEGYRVLSCRVKSSSGDLITEDYIVTKAIKIFVEYQKIDMNSIHELTEKTSDLKDYSFFASTSETAQNNFYQNGYVADKMPDYSQYQNTSAYVKVSTADEFINALSNAKIDYTSEVDSLLAEQQMKVRNNVRKNESNWKSAITKGLYLKNTDGTFTKIPEDTPFDPNDTTYTASMTYYEESDATTVSIKQTLNSDQKVHVIEITEDLNLGYNKLSSASQALVTNWASSKTGFSETSHYLENGVSQINISNSNNLLIYSKNGSKITNAGFKVTSCDRVTFRNLKMDEIWQWEDSPSQTPSFTVGDMDVFGWAYFKISYSGYIWIDHCTFGKSYDGQIDVSNPYYYSQGTAYRAPYGKPATYTESESGGVNISNCRFEAGSDDKDGYLYKMMEEIEADYQKSKSNSSYSCKYLYYKTLRDTYNLSFDEILYGVAIPQKKAFLLGDSSESKNVQTYHYNQALKVSLINNLIIDIEDRLPNVRGGIGYMANCVIDCSRYFRYRTLLQSKGAGGISGVNSKYKLALVSQGIVGGYGASIYANNCLVIGVGTFVKNNNKDKDDITTEQIGAGYRIENTKWYYDADSSDYDRIIDTVKDPSQIQKLVDSASSNAMTTTNFSWHNQAGTNPFDVKLFDLDKLTDSLINDIHVGAYANYGNLYLYTKAEYYTIK